MRKAVIPAAGLGTRFLPATKAMPKEMLPLVDKPAIQYVVEEAVRAGLTDIVMITGRNKRPLEDHFDREPSLEQALERKGDHAKLAAVRASSSLADIHYVRQGDALGLGHAVLRARRHVGHEPFAVLLGDDLIDEQDDILGTMAMVQAATGGSVVALMEVKPSEISAYGCADVVPSPGGEGFLRIAGLVEKPEAADAPSNLAVIGRYVLHPRVFDVLAETPPGRGGEIQLTDALQALARAGEAWLLANGTEAMKGNRAGGVPLMFSNITERNIMSMLNGTGLGFLIISVILMGALRSFRLGLLSLVPNILPIPALGFALLAAAGRLLGPGVGPGALQPVLRGLPNNVTTEMDLALWRLASAIRSDAGVAAVFAEATVPDLAQRYRSRTLPAAVQSGVAGFLARYGHRAVAEIDLGMPRWADDPAHILGVLANYLRLEDPDQAPDRQFARAARDAEAQVDRLVAAAGERGRLRAVLVRAALRRTRMFAGLRELPKYHIVEALAAVRSQLQAIGTGLAAAGTIADADDVFFLDLVEVRAALAGSPLHHLAAERREAYVRELARRHIPRVLLSDGTEPEALQPAGTAGRAPGVLTGTPASAGTVMGTARVILEPLGAHLEPGEILVAPSTDPGWTPLFLTAGGLVMEMGGPNSHGAVVAREYGIPAVVGVPDATSLIRTGQAVLVDGAAGTVVPDRPLETGGRAPGGAPEESAGQR